MFLVEFLPFTLLIVVVVAMLAGRSEPDPDRERPTALYLSAATFLGILVFLAALFATITGFVKLTDSSQNFGGWQSYSFDGRSESTFGSRSGSGSVDGVPFPFPSTARRPGLSLSPGKLVPGAPRIPSRTRLLHAPRTTHDDDVSMIVDGLIVGGLAAGVITFHGRRLRDLGLNSSGPGARVYARHLYLVCSATMLAALVAGGVALHSIFAVIAPDTAGVGSRADAARTLAATGVLALVALTVFRANWKRSEALNTTASSRLPGPHPPPPAPRLDEQE